MVLDLLGCVFFVFHFLFVFLCSKSYLLTFCLFVLFTEMCGLSLILQSICEHLVLTEGRETKALMHFLCWFFFVVVMSTLSFRLFMCLNKVMGGLSVLELGCLGWS